MAPAHAGKSVKLEIRRNGVLISSRLVTLDASSRYALTWRPPTVASYSVKAVFAADSDHLGNSSPLKTFRVV